MQSLISIETTPNPNSIKLNLSEPLGCSGTFIASESLTCPELIKRLLTISGVQSVFVADDFLTLNRDPRADWQEIIQTARVMLLSGDDALLSHDEPGQLSESPEQGQVQVLVQIFRDIPIQVKITDGVQEHRASLPERFTQVARALQTRFGADYLKERYWADWGSRYGNLSEVAQEVVEEIESRLDESSLKALQERLLNQAMGKALPVNPVLAAVTDAGWQLADWPQRLKLIQEIEVSSATLPVLKLALHDKRPGIRRWAAAKLAGLKNSESVALLSERLLNDDNVGVRRTAGDSLSDIGDVSAQDTVCRALKDPNKLVRWRAARFLAEVGNAQALPYLEAAMNESEYEVRHQMESAIQHIKNQSKAALPVWKQMAQG